MKSFFLVSLALLLAAAAVPASAQQTGPRSDQTKLRHLGPAIEVNSVFVAAEMGAGKDRTFVGVVRSTESARLFVFDPASARVTHTARLGQTKGSWAVEADERFVYIGTYMPAEVYRFDVLTGSLDLVATLPEPTSFVWDMALAGDDLILGTYPDSKLYRLDAGTGELTDFGSLSQEEYVRSVSVRGGKVYAGIGASAELVEFDLETGETRQLLPSAYSSESFAYWTGFVGDSLLVGLEPSNRIISLDPASLESRELMPDAANGPVTVPDAGEGHTFRGYFDFMYHLDAGGKTLSRVLSSGMSHLTAGGVRDGRISGFTRNGIYVEHGLDGRLLRSVRLADAGLEPDPGLPFSIAAANGTLFVAERDLRVLDTATGDDRTYPVIGEPKVMCATADFLYSANYNGAVVWQFPLEDIFGRREIDLNDPTFIIWDIGDEQNRPHDIICGDDHVLVATEPNYGRYGGALNILHADGRRELLRDLVPDHSIYSIAAQGDDVFLGSAAYGGTGAQPLDGDARIVKYNLQSRKIAFDIAPAARNKRVLSLAAADGKLFAVMQKGALLRLDAGSGSVEQTADDASLTRLLAAGDGSLYGLRKDALVRIDKDSLAVSTVAPLHNAKHIADDPASGTLWLVADLQLYGYRYGAAADAAPDDP